MLASRLSLAGIVDQQTVGFEGAQIRDRLAEPLNELRRIEPPVADLA